MCLQTERHQQDFFKIYYNTPLYANDIHPNDMGEILDIYSKANSLEDRDFFTMLHFSNWINYKVKENHAFGLLFPTKEMLALVFVVEQVYKIESSWKRNFRTHELEGGWNLK